MIAVMHFVLMGELIPELVETLLVEVLICLDKCDWLLSFCLTADLVFTLNDTLLHGDGFFETRLVVA